VTPQASTIPVRSFWRQATVLVCNAAAVLAVSATSARADEGLAAQYQTARAVFGADADPPVLTARTLNGLDGAWVVVMADWAQPFDIAAHGEACSRRSLRIARVSPLSFTVTVAEKTGEIAHRFTATGGSRFFRSVDDAALLVAYGMDRPGREALALGTVAQILGPVNIFRPSPDILAIVNANGTTQLWVRCPDAGTK